MNNYFIKDKKNGYVTLVTVLIVAAIAISISVYILLSGLNTSRSMFSIRQSTQAWSLASACTEEGLQQVRALTSYTGTGSLTFSDGTCSYTVTNLGGNVRQIDGQGTVGTHIRKVRVTTSALSPQIIISSWLEVAI